MKKISLLYVVLFANFLLVSCTEENLSDATNTPEDHYAIDGETENTDDENKPLGD